jgi:hypothetical protein
MTTYTDGIGQLRCNGCLALAEHCHCPPSHPKGWRPMFAPNTPMVLSNVEFTTEVVDEETRRIVVCTFNVVPFTAELAEDLHVRSVLFDATTGQPKEAIEAVVLSVDAPLQLMTFAMAPDQTDLRIQMPDAQIESKLRVKIKHDRDPLMVEAALKVSFHYPSATDLLYIANGVNDTHYMTFEPMQGDLLDATVHDGGDGVELRPGVFAEH